MFKRLKLADSDGRISLTNLAVYVVLFAFVYTVVCHRGIEVTSLGALFTALLAYRVKAHQLDMVEARDAVKLKGELAELRKQARVPAQPFSQPLPPGLMR